MKHLSITLAATGMLLATALATNALAWSASGHYIISLIGFDLLNKANKHKRLPIIYHLTTD